MRARSRRPVWPCLHRKSERWHVCHRPGQLGQHDAAGIAVEVIHLAERRLFGLEGLTPLRDQVAPPRQPEPGRYRWRPPMSGCA